MYNFVFLLNALDYLHYRLVSSFVMPVNLFHNIYVNFQQMFVFLLFSVALTAVLACFLIAISFVLLRDIPAL